MAGLFPKAALKDAFASLGKCVCDSALLMIGMPDYDAYVAHIRSTHPEAEPMSYADFFRERQSARYGGSGTAGARTFRCC